MHLGGYYRIVTLVRSGKPDDDIDALRARVTGLESTLIERDAAVAQVRVDLAAFKVRYRQDVGLLHDELDELERAIEEAELAHIMGHPVSSGQPAETPPTTRPQSEAAPRFTSDGVRRLFRDVARTIHPDLALDDLTRDRRHRLMVEANRAYALGDEQRLRQILEHWERSPEAVQGDDLDAARLRLERRLAQLQEQIEACALEVTELQDSPIWRLKAMVDDAAAGGKDLIADMVRRLERDIMAARNRLDAMQSHR
jgi:hypothetical protein